MPNGAFEKPPTPVAEKKEESREEILRGEIRTLEGKLAEIALTLEERKRLKEYEVKYDAIEGVFHEEWDRLEKEAGFEGGFEGEIQRRLAVEEEGARAAYRAHLEKGGRPGEFIDYPMSESEIRDEVLPLEAKELERMRHFKIMGLNGEYQSELRRQSQVRHFEFMKEEREKELKGLEERARAEEEEKRKTVSYRRKIGGAFGRAMKGV